MHHSSGCRTIKIRRACPSSHGSYDQPAPLICLYGLALVLRYKLPFLSFLLGMSFIYCWQVGVCHLGCGANNVWFICCITVQPKPKVFTMDVWKSLYHIGVKLWPKSQLVCGVIRFGSRAGLELLTAHATMAKQIPECSAQPGQNVDKRTLSLLHWLIVFFFKIQYNVWGEGLSLLLKCKPEG